MSNSTCTSEEQALFNSTRGTSVVCLTRGDTIGLTLIAESGFISLVAVLVAFIVYFRNAFRDRILIRHSADIYMLSLFTFDTIMALGNMADIKWIGEGKLYTGGFCTTQGILLQLGDTGSALATLVIAVHTFVVVLWNHEHSSVYAAYFIVALTWAFVAFFTAMGVTIHTQGSNFYETPVGYWCWIGTRFKAEQYSGQYVWVWLTMLVSFFAYTPLFFWARGNISISRRHWWKLKCHRSMQAEQDIDPDTDSRWRSVRMIAYPIVFTVTTLPLSVVRWESDFGSARQQFSTATFTVVFIYGLTGLG